MTSFLVFQQPASAWSQGWLDITPPGLVEINRFQTFESTVNGYEIYAWGEVGFRFTATSTASEFESYWVECCECGPIPFGEVPWSLGSLAKVSDDPPLLLSMYSTPGCVMVVPFADLFLDSTASRQNMINFFPLYGYYCPAVVAVKPYLTTSAYVHAADSLYHSNDGGESFQGISRICDSLSVSACPELLVFHSQIDGLGFAGGMTRSCDEGFLFRTTDNGVTWHAILEVPVRSIVFDPLVSDVVYAASDSGLFKSWDEGETWLPIKGGGVASIEVGMPDNDFLYAGSLAGELWRSTNAGVQWSLYNNTFSTEAVIGLHKDTESDTIIACASDGIFKVYDSFVVGVEEWSEEITEEVRLYQNYPNPVNPTTTFEFSLRSSLFANLTVYNLLGREIAVLVNEKLTAGTHTVRWNATVLPSGVYFYRLTAGEFVQTEKLVLLR